MQISCEGIVGKRRDVTALQRFGAHVCSDDESDFGFRFIVVLNSNCCDRVVTPCLYVLGFILKNE